MTAKGLENVVVVLDEPQNVVNIAGVVRSMKNMGVHRLRLVRPLEFDEWRITGIAHRSEDVVEGAEFFDRLDEALSDCLTVVGTTARARTAHRNYHRPRERAGWIVERTSRGPVALLFGREDRGLSNEALDLCDEVIVVPTAPDYSSLNLAQACLLLLYELRTAAEAGERPLPRGKRTVGPATRGEMESMFQALEQGLDRIEFFNARTPQSVMRTLRTLLARADPDGHEAGLVRAVGFEIVNYIDRVEQQDREPGGG